MIPKKNYSFQKPLIGFYALFVFFILSLFIFVSPAEAAKIAVVKGDYVNIRTGPGISYPITTQVLSNTRLNVIDESNQWLKVTLPDGKTGWVANWLVMIEDHPDVNPSGSTSSENTVSDITVTKPEKKQIGIVTGDYINLRSGPGTSFSLVTTVEQGTRMNILGQSGEWYQVKLNDGMQGWVAGWLIEVQNVVQLVINGQIIEPEVPPQIIAGHTLVPVRVISENLGANVSWDGESRTVTIALKTQTIKLQIDSQTAYINGKQTSLDVPAQLIESKTMVPLRFIAEALGTDVSWDGDNYRVIITRPTLTNVRFSIFNDSGTKTVSSRIVFDLSAPVKYQIDRSNDNYLLITFPKTFLKYSSNNVMVNDGIVKTVELDSSQPFNVQAKINLTQRADYKVLVLQQDPVKGTPYRLVFDFDRSQMSLAGKTIAIDPGHGGSDPGAIGPTRSFEKDNTLAIALLLKDLLLKANANVVMTRETDRDVYGPYASAQNELQARVDVANRQKADLFIDIHHNASTSATLAGIQTFYSSKNKNSASSQRLAQTLFSELVKQTGMKGLNVQDRDFYVLKNTAMPAALLEIGFISNPNEEKLLLNPEFRQKVAQAIFDGIVKYFSPQPK